MQIQACADTSEMRMPAEKYDYDVLVLGGGMSGISAAAALHKAGKSFLVLEQAAQIGGRMRAVKFGGDIVEKGANWYDT
jgi:phytoene dehydrogenase-like protein